MNDEIELMFSNFLCPVEFMDYKGNEETYVVYHSTGEVPALHGDNRVLGSIDTYDFHIYTKGNYLTILKELKKILENNGWSWIEDSEDYFESDTHFFNKVTTWSKERIDY